MRLGIDVGEVGRGALAMKEKKSDNGTISWCESIMHVMLLLIAISQSPAPLLPLPLDMSYT